MLGDCKSHNSSCGVISRVIGVMREDIDESNKRGKVKYTDNER
jgi:hypothetical protein